MSDTINENVPSDSLVENDASNDEIMASSEMPEEKSNDASENISSETVQVDSNGKSEDVVTGDNPSELVVNPENDVNNEQDRGKEDEPEKVENESKETEEDANKEEPIFKAFVGNLPDKTTVEALQDLFQPYGPIVKCEVVKRWGFVELSDEPNLLKAIEELNGRTFNDATIAVERSRAKPKKKKPAQKPDEQTEKKDGEAEKKSVPKKKKKRFFNLIFKAGKALSARKSQIHNRAQQLNQGKGKDGAKGKPSLKGASGVDKNGSIDKSKDKSKHKKKAKGQRHPFTNELLTKRQLRRRRERQNKQKTLQRLAKENRRATGFSSRKFNDNSRGFNRNFDERNMMRNMSMRDMFDNYGPGFRNGSSFMDERRSYSNMMSMGDLRRNIMSNNMSMRDSFDNYGPNFDMRDQNFMGRSRSPISDRMPAMMDNRRSQYDRPSLMDTDNWGGSYRGDRGRMDGDFRSNYMNDNRAFGMNQSSLMDVDRNMSGFNDRRQMYNDNNDRRQSYMGNDRQQYYGENNSRSQSFADNIDTYDDSMDRRQSYGDNSDRRQSTMNRSSYSKDTPVLNSSLTLNRWGNTSIMKEDRNQFNDSRQSFNDSRSHLLGDLYNNDQSYKSYNTSDTSNYNRGTSQYGNTSNMSSRGYSADQVTSLLSNFAGGKTSGINPWTSARRY